jgi:hypothetical protein
MTNHQKLFLFTVGLFTANLAHAQGTEAVLSAFFGMLFLCGMVIVAAAAVMIRYIWTRRRMERWVCGVAGASFFALGAWHVIMPDGNESTIIAAVGCITGFLCTIIAVFVGERSGG